MSRAGPPAPPVVAVVVAYGAPQLLDECLASLSGGPPVVVVDNSCDPEVRSVATRHDVTFIDPGTNLGFAGGVNTGMSGRADADVLLVNPDATITPDDIAVLCRCLHADDRLACVAPRQVSPATGETDRVAWPFPTPLGAWVEAVGLGRLRRRADFLIGSVLLLRSTALDGVGAFDEQFFPLYAEEADWQRRARQLGWSVRLCAEATATHVGAGTGGDPRRREVYFHAGQERYIRKHHGRVGWAIYRAAAVAGALPRALLLSGERRQLAAGRLRLYWHGPTQVQQQLSPTSVAGKVPVEQDPR
jgi:GT2 family glycosyltransferase